METTRNRTTILGKVSGIVSVGVLLFLLTLGSPNVKGQNLLKAGFPRCAYPPLAPRPNGLGLGGAEVLGGQVDQHPLPAITTIMRCAYPPLAPRENGLGLGGAEVLGGQVHQHPLPAITTIMRCAYPPPAGAGGGSASSSKQNLVQKIYTSQLGVREKQPNSGKEVEKYLRYVNLPKGNPWCAAFVCWTLGEAGISNPRTGWSPALFGERHIVWSLKEQGTKSKPAWPVGREQRLPPGVSTCGHFPDLIGDLVTTRGHQPQVSGAYLAVQNPANLGLQLRWRLLNPGNLKCAVDASFAASAEIRPGLDPGSSRGTAFAACAPRTADIFGLFFPEKGRIAHVGFVDDWQDPWVTTVEGNTNVLGSREGDGVYRKRRLIASIYKVARYIN